MADEPEVYGLLALMLLHDSRREARVVDGQLVPLAEQDRSRHDRAKVEAGRAALGRAMALRPAGRAVRAPGGDRLAPGRGGGRLGRGRGALGAARAADRLAGRGAEPRGGRRRGGRARTRARARRTRSSSRIYRYLHSMRAELLRRLGRRDEEHAGSVITTGGSGSRKGSTSRLSASGSLRRRRMGSSDGGS